MKKFIYNRILVWTILVGLVASLIICWQRYNVETNNSQIDMVLDYDSVTHLAEQEGLDFFEVLHRMKGAGITSIAVYDATFEKLNRQGKVYALQGSEIIGHNQSGLDVDEIWRQAIEAGLINPDRVYIIGRNLQTYEEVKKDITLRLGTNRVTPIIIGDMEILEVKDRYEIFMKKPITMPSEELAIVKDAGLNIVARPANFLGCTPDTIREVFKRFDGYPVVEMVFSGNEVLGAYDYVDVTAEEMKKRNITFGIIESYSQLQFYPQAGMEQLARDLGYDRVARLHVIPPYDQNKISLHTAIYRWLRTDYERNIRINLFRIYEKQAAGMTLAETNFKYISETAKDLRNGGYTLGKAGTFEDYYPNRFLRFLVIIGTVAAGVLCLSLISRELNERTRLQITIFVALAILAGVPILMGAGGKVRLIAALVSANVFPALAVIWQLDRLRSIRVKARWQSIRSKSEGGSEYPKVRVKTELSIGQVIWLSLASLFITSLVSMAGAAYLAGALSDVIYFLEFEIFRGIKLTFVMPLILVGVAFLQRYNIIDEMRKSFSAGGQLKEILEMEVTVKNLLMVFVVIFALAILVIRSGHSTGMPVLDLEVRLREWLEDTFYARPRSKELFLGHPAFVLAVAAFLKKFPKKILLALTIVATIGQSSMVETFAHVHTPIFVSFMRGVDGLIPGAILGVVAILMAYYAAKLKAKS